MSEEIEVELQRTVGRIEAKLDMLLERDDDRETRVRALEKWKDESTGRIWGASAVVTALFAAIKFLWESWKT